MTLLALFQTHGLQENVTLWSCFQTWNCDQTLNTWVCRYFLERIWLQVASNYFCTSSSRNQPNLKKKSFKKTHQYDLVTMKVIQNYWVIQMRVNTENTKSCGNKLTSDFAFVLYKLTSAQCLPEGHGNTMASSPVPGHSTHRPASFPGEPFGFSHFSHVPF